MRTFIFQLLIVVAIITIVAAVVFRSRRAWDILHILRRAGWAYVIAIVVLAVYRLWQG